MEFAELPAPRALRALRLAADQTQEAVAALIGASQPTVSAYEHGNSRPRGDVRARYLELIREWRERV